MPNQTLYLCADVSLNTGQRVVTENGHVKSLRGVFPESCLRSLRLAPSKRLAGTQTMQ